MPTEEQTYRKSMDDKLTSILEQVRYTNGRVRLHEKLIWALCAGLAVTLADHSPQASNVLLHIFGL